VSSVAGADERDIPGLEAHALLCAAGLKVFVGGGIAGFDLFGALARCPKSRSAPGARIGGTSSTPYFLKPREDCMLPSFIFTPP